MPLLFDMPLEKLYTYPGTNPRPDDHDSYWAAALAEMHAVDPAIELKPAGFQTSFARCSHLYFTGVGGARIHAKLLQPKHQDAAGPEDLNHGCDHFCSQAAQHRLVEAGSTILPFGNTILQDCLVGGQFDPIQCAGTDEHLGVSAPRDKKNCFLGIEPF